MKLYPIGLLAPAALATLAFLAAGCSSQNSEEGGETSGLTVHEMMISRIDPDADAIWEIGNAAIANDASMDPALMTDKSWQDLAAASDRMAGHVGDLARLDPLTVTRPGVKIADEGVAGAPTPAQIQAHMDRDAETFRSLAQTLANHSTELAAAARLRNASEAGRLINEMDGVCESCHLEFWYPEQKALIEQMGLLP